MYDIDCCNTTLSHAIHVMRGIINQVLMHINRVQCRRIYVQVQPKTKLTNASLVYVIKDITSFHYVTHNACVKFQNQKKNYSVLQRESLFFNSSSTFGKGHFHSMRGWYFKVLQGITRVACLIFVLELDESNVRSVRDQTNFFETVKSVQQWTVDSVRLNFKYC